MKTAAAKTESAASGSSVSPFFRKGGSEGLYAASDTPFFHHQPVQTKLTIGQPNDKYEKEADAMADQVVQRLSDSDTLQTKSKLPAGSITPIIQTECAACEEEKLQKKEEGLEELEDKIRKKPIFESSTAPPPDDVKIQRQCAACEHEQEATLQAKSSANASVVNAPTIESRLTASKGSGTPLPEYTRTQMESSFGADFTHVRIHNDSSAVQMNKDLQAYAFTHGSDVYFNAGKYDVNSKQGQHLLAHELTHVLQQQSTSKPKQDTTIGSGGSRLKTNQPQVQGAWYNFSIPFTDYEFDPSIEGLKTAGGLAKDAAVWTGGKVKEGAVFIKDKAVEAFDWVVDKIAGLVNDGIDWLKGKFNDILEFGNTVFDRLKNNVSSVMSFLTSPIDVLAGAMANMNVGTLDTAWSLLKNGANTVWNLVKTFVNGALSIGNGIWEVVSGGVDSIFNKIQYWMDSWAFSMLPDFLQRKARDIFNRIKNFWEFVRNYWNSIWTQLTNFVEKLLASVEDFVTKVVSFAIDKVIQTVKTLKEVYDFIKRIVDDPEAALRPYVDAVASLITTKGPDKTREVGREKLDEYFGNKGEGSASGLIQKAPIPGAERSTASRDEINETLEIEFSAQWAKLDIKSMLWDSFKTMFIPLETIKAIGHEFYELWNTDWANAASSLYAPSFESVGTFFHDVWSNILILVEFPLALIRRIENILMLLMGYVTIILILVGFFGGAIAGGGAFSVPGALAGAWAGAQLAFVLGEALFVAFILTESTYLLKLFADLHTARQTQEEKNRDYKNIAGGVIGMGIAVLIVLIFMILSALVKMVINKIRGPSPEAPKAAEGEGKTDKPKVEGSNTEAPKLEGEVASLDGQRSVNITEKGKIWVCASPCQELRLKYEAEIKADPKLEERIRTLEEGYEKLNSTEKAARNAEVKKLEQELADIKGAKEGTVRAPKELKWPPKEPIPPKPDITTPNAAEWRYERYAYEKFMEGASKKEVLPPDEWMRRYFEPSAEGGRPGRPGGPEQVAAKNALAKEGVKIVENVELGGRYPDGIDPKPNAKGGRNYFEVGEMLKKGIPEARERVKIADEIKAMGPDDTVTFVDKKNVANRVTYKKGSTPEFPSSRTFTVE